MTGINEVAKEIHENAVEHGWWENERSFPEVIALCHSELSEALEEYRSGRPMVWHKCPYNGGACGEQEVHQGEYGCTNCTASKRKPEGIAVEMADCIIRILDWCGKEGVDIDKIISEKHEYNKTRSYKHGGKVC